MAQKCVFAPAEAVLAHGETAAVLGESSEKHTLAFSAPSICPELVLTNRRFSKSEKGGLQWKHTKGVFSFAHCTLTLWCWLSPVVETSAPGRFPTSAMLPPQRNTVPFLSFASMSVPSLSWQKIVLREKTAQQRAVPHALDPVLLLTLAGSFSFLQNRPLLSSVFVLFSPKPVLATDHRLAVENRRNGTFSHRGVFILLLAQQQPLLGPALQLVHSADKIGAE
jgi:hypothetical protein